MNTKINTLLEALSTVIYDKQPQVKLAICSLLCKGHLLIEDLPGMGKTTLSHGLAEVLGLTYQRVQFTSDLLPADITGSTIFNTDKQSFVFHEGPVFTQVLLADEINRASPKTQSALLEAMEERQVTMDGQSHSLPEPFFVIATQNPLHQSGTHPLPESQLDRFFMRVSLGYPSKEAEKKLILGEHGRKANLTQLMKLNTLSELQLAIEEMEIKEQVVQYILDLVSFTRESGLFKDPLSPRASIAIGTASKAWAMIHGRDYVTHDDVQAVFPAIAGHRLNLDATEQFRIIDDIYAQVPVQM
ncbi:AAA family ATPase [Pseudoalteromonas phenolica]|uniref:AAA family ATPase n=1 Tax=Pseudoalteromonas phenolica TaxID=161398 RepID=A0A5S3YRX1_9GAMM|nr:AAA family ATPase [Pseudoalteromonas phenolica]TMP78877.1 AAA family ATPase [Pseudoalteromonas phenolica]